MAARPSQSPLKERNERKFPDGTMIGNEASLVTSYSRLHTVASSAISQEHPGHGTVRKRAYEILDKHSCGVRLSPDHVRGIDVLHTASQALLLISVLDVLLDKWANFWELPVPVIQRRGNIEHPILLTSAGG